MGALLFLISRLWFLNWDEVFFDSGEYISRWANPNYFSAIISGHPPLHLGYILYNWPVFRLFERQGLNPLPAILLVQVTLALLCVFFFGKVVSRLVEDKTANRAMILVSLLPIFWIVNVTVMMETGYLFFFFGSLFFLSKYTSGDEKYRYLILSTVFWMMAFLTHTVVLIWIPFWLYLAWMWSKKRFIKILIAGILSLLVASAINASFLANSLKTTLDQGFYWLYAAKFGEHAWFSFDVETIGRYLRNWWIPLVYNNTSPIVIIGLLSFSSMWKTNKKLFWLGVFWIAPSLIANQWWDSLLYGRHALIAGFGLAFYVSVLLKGISYRIISLIVLVISLPTLSLLSHPIPYNLMSDKISQLPGGGLLIDSHFARPYTDGNYFGKTIYVDEPGWNTAEAARILEKYIDNRRDVYVTGHALSEPYGLFSGPYLHPLSLSYKNPYILQQITDKWGFAEFEEVNRGLNLMVYKVIPQSGKYATIKRLDENSRRIDYYDPLRLFMSAIKGGLNL